MPDAKEVEHGVALACYALSQCGTHDPYLECLCGFVATDLTWAEAGALFDEHHAEVEKAAK